jgi:hypothetical protein
LSRTWSASFRVSGEQQVCVTGEIRVLVREGDLADRGVVEGADADAVLGDLVWTPRCWNCSLSVRFTKHP